MTAYIRGSKFKCPKCGQSIIRIAFQISKTHPNCNPLNKTKSKKQSGKKNKKRKS